MNEISTPATPSPTSDTSLSKFQPQPTHGNPWSDTWYYYINDEKVGYFKIAFLTYLNDRTEARKQHAYLHVAHTPINGEKREYHYYSDAVISEPVKSSLPYAFKFIVPDVATITESTLDLHLPKVAINVTLSDHHRHYFNGGNGAASPFIGETGSSYSTKSHWFVFSMATPARYSYKDNFAELSGTGLTYIERGWSSGQAMGFSYIAAVSEQASLMLSGGMVDDSGNEVWAGKLITGTSEIVFLPFSKGHVANSNIDSAEARLNIDIEEGDHRIKVRSHAPLAEFYNQVTPSLTVFHADNSVMKTMNAKLDIELYKNDQLIESIQLNQSILEFGGLRYCQEMKKLADCSDGYTYQNPDK